MAGFQKLDKKQLPQVIGLGALSVGLFGYFAVKMVTPTVSAAPTIRATPPAAIDGKAATGGGKAAGAPGVPAPTTEQAAEAPPPSAGMRDPFVAPILTASTAPPPATPPVKPPVQVAAINPLPVAGGDLHVPFAPALPPGGGQMPTAAPSAGPAMGRLAPMPALPAAPTWTLTGILQSGAANVAILRDGAVRKFAHRGDIVGGEFRVVDMTRQSVVLQHGDRHYVLPLGGPKPPSTTPEAPAPAASFLPTAGGPAATSTAPVISTPAVSVPIIPTPAVLAPLPVAGVAPQAATTPSAQPSSTTLNTLQQLAGK